MRLTISTITFLLALGTVPFAQAQAIYSAVGDFSIKSNPNGVWTYLGSGTAFTLAATGTGGNTGLIYWSNNGGLSNFNGVFANISGKTVNVSDVNIVPDHLDMSPNSGNITVRFTAPSAGKWSAVGDFLGIEAHTEQSHNVAVLLNGASVFSAIVNAVGQSAPFNLALTLKAGDLVDFVNFAGATVDFDNTGLAAIVAPILPPVITTNGIGPIFSPATTVQSGSWVTIYGSNLAPAAAIWAGDFPTSLGGTSVTIDSKPAYLWYVSPGQINLQVPDDSASGTVPVTISTAGGTASGVVTLGSYAPSLSLFSARYPATIAPASGGGNSGAGYDYIGPAGAFSFPSRPIKAGETILLYGVGFGPTTNSVSPGKLFSGAAPCTVFPTVTIGGVPATVTFAGIVQAGLYQLNVVVPNAGSGDQLLQVSAGGLPAQNNLYLTLQ
jgi:uncharacterized protein (TIGR03437 family)